MEICPICKYELIEVPGLAGTQFNCPNCGQYSISDRAIRIIPDDKIDRAILSHAIKQFQKENTFPKINQKFVREIIQNRSIPGPSEQADNLIFWFGENTKKGGELKVVFPQSHQAVAGSIDADELLYVLEYLFEKDLIIGEARNCLEYYPAKIGMTLTFKGWDYYDELKRGSFDSRTVFMAMPFNLDDVNKVFECYKDAVDKTGFTLLKLDDNPQAGLIDDRMRVEILKAHFLIVDITYANPGAYWEAGFAEGLGKKVIYSCMRDYFDKKPPYDNEYGSHFDTNHHQTIIWEPDKFAEAGEKLKATIRATFPDMSTLED